MAFWNRYKDTLDDLINSSNLEFPDPESLNQPGPIDKGLYNSPKLEWNLTNLLKRNFLDQDVSDRSSQLAAKTEDF